MKYLIILGADDLEMRAAEKVIRQNPEKAVFQYAVDENGKRVNPASAYAYHGTQTPVDMHIDWTSITFVAHFECRQSGKTQEDIPLDHHNQGDYGYNGTPENAVASSSLGQLARMLNVELTKEQRVIAAADHNLKGAYSSLVSGVTAEEVLEVRLPELAQRNKVTVEEAKFSIQETMKVVSKEDESFLVRTEKGLVKILDFTDFKVMPYLTEACLCLGKNFIGRVDTRDENKIILSAPPEVIEKFLNGDFYENSTEKYGVPAREFAGGTLTVYYKYALCDWQNVNSGIAWGPIQCFHNRMEAFKCLQNIKNNRGAALLEGWFCKP